MFKFKKAKIFSNAAGALGYRKNILITGGAGFIGSHLAEELVKESNVICVDNFSTSSMENIRFLMASPNFVFIKHDINNPFVLEDFRELEKFSVKVFGVQEIYNLACPTSAKKFDKLSIATVLANSAGVKNILDLALKYEAKLVHASSAVVYGPRIDNRYIAEDFHGTSDILSPRACYDEGKRFAESLISTYARANNKDFKIARIFRTYGPRLMLNDGQMISDFILNAIDGNDLEIFGDNDFSTSLLYVSDAVDGLMKLMESEYHGAINLGSDVDMLIKDVAEQIIGLTKSTSKIVYRNPLAFITQLPLPDIKKAKSMLGWYPLVTLQSGLEKTLDYTRANKQILDNLAE